YPIAAVLVSEQCAGWLTEDGFAHISTFGGAELGCVAALKTLEICSRPETRSMVHYISALIGSGLRGIQAGYPDWFTGIRQHRVDLAGQAAAGPGALGGRRLRHLRPGVGAADRRGGGQGRARAGREVRRVGGQGDRVRRGRAQDAEEPGLLARGLRALPGRG